MLFRSASKRGISTYPYTQFVWLVRFRVHCLPGGKDVQLLQELAACAIMHVANPFARAVRTPPPPSVCPSPDANTHLLMSLLKTSTIFLMSATSTGSFAAPITENGLLAAPSSTKPPPGARRPPTRRISKSSLSYLR